MQNDHLFRIVLLCGFAILAPVGIYHRLRSQASGEKLQRREEGIFILVSLRLFGFATLAASAAWMINPDWMEWSTIPLPRWLRWTGAALVPVFVILLSWVFASLGRNLTDTVVTRAQHTLVTTGPYRWVRHPFYASAAVGWVAGSLLMQNWFVAATGSGALVLLLIRTDVEEQKLIQRFGNDYRAYMSRTGRFLPSPKRSGHQDQESRP